MIVAQAPMHSTVSDFWALIKQRKVPVVLLMCPKQEHGKVSKLKTSMTYLYL